MNPTTQNELVQAIRLDNATAWTSFITAHTNMVHEMAHALAMCPDQYDELVSEGTVALCEAAHEFVAGTYNCRFTTHAYYPIQRAMVSFQRTEGGMSSEWLARCAVKTKRDLERLRDKFGALDMGRDPTPEDLAYVSIDRSPDDDDVRRFAVRLQGTPKFTGIDYTIASEQSTDCIDKPFAESLLPATRHIWLGLLEQVCLTGNASLGLEAQRNRIPRAEVVNRVCGALRQWANNGSTCS